MYLKWDEKTITDWSDDAVSALYNQGYLFGRTGRGEMYQTRSLRIDLQNFELSSENRRVLKKTEALKLAVAALPYSDYHFSIGKLGKDFYDSKFGAKTFSANKIKEIMTDEKKSNFDTVLVYSLETTVGYALCYQNSSLLHYCYPFYDLTNKTPNLGLGMMLKAVLWAKENNKKYVYLGSFSRPTDTYKLQFAGLEWWDGKAWQSNPEDLKKISHA